MRVGGAHHYVALVVLRRISSSVGRPLLPKGRIWPPSHRSDGNVRDWKTQQFHTLCGLPDCVRYMLALDVRNLPHPKLSAPNFISESTNRPEPFPVAMKAELAIDISIQHSFAWVNTCCGASLEPISPESRARRNVTVTEICLIWMANAPRDYESAVAASSTLILLSSSWNWHTASYINAGQPYWPIKISLSPFGNGG